MSSNAALIHGAGSVNIHNGSFVIDNRRTASDIQSLPPGIKTLIGSGHISWTSLHNSLLRMNEANELAVRNAVVGWRSLLEYKTTCGPSFDLSGVDDAVNAILSWVTDSTAEPLIMWVHDDDRRKTSFIAQVVAYLLAERCLLSATYFFDENTDRNSLVPTLVHEFTMQHNHHDLLAEISKVIEKNPVGIFNYNHREQLSRLLVGPLRIVSESYQPDLQRQPRYDVILLHAFEDCNNEGGFQESFLDALLEALISIKNLKYPQRLLVIGKRTDHLEEFLTRKLALRSPILQRPVQGQQWLERDQHIRQKFLELERVEKELRQALSAANDREVKMIREHRQLEEDFERIKSLSSKKMHEVVEGDQLPLIPEEYTDYHEIMPNRAERVGGPYKIIKGPSKAWLQDQEENARRRLSSLPVPMNEGYYDLEPLPVVVGPTTFKVPPTADMPLKSAMKKTGHEFVWRTPDDP